MTEANIGFRLTKAEKEKLQEQADLAKLTLSEYVRRRALGRKVVAKIDMAVLAELRRMGGLLKHVHTETRGMYSELTAEAIREITRFMRSYDRKRRDTEPGE